MGVIGGLALASNVETLVPAIEQAFNTKFLPAGVYYITDVPSDIHTADVVVVAAASFIMTVLATLYPSWRASRDPTGRGAAL